MFPFGRGVGAGKEEDDEVIIARDQKEHPNCSYSKSYSKSCSYSSEKGGLVCESARQIFRVCANKAPVQILNTRSKNDSSKEDAQAASSSGPAPESLFDLFKDLQDVIHQQNQNQQQQQQQQQKKKEKKWSIADFDQGETGEGGEGSWRA